MRIKNIVIMFFIILSLPFFLTGVISGTFDIALIGVLFFFIGFLLYSISLKEKAILMTFFLISFFTFLLGQYTVKMLCGQEWDNNFSDDIMRHILTCLYVSLVFIFLGFIAKRDKMTEGPCADAHHCSETIIRTINLLFFLTYFFNVICVLDKVIFVRNNSYLSLYSDYYIEYIYRIPYVIQKLGQLNPFMYYALLSTMASKRTIAIPTALFLLTACLSILTGARSAMIVPFMFVCMYYIYREITSRRCGEGKNRWIKKWHVWATIVTMPCLIIFLSVYSSLRNGLPVQNINVFNELYSFFRDQGGSVNIIGYEKIFEDYLPKTNHSYFFGPIITLFNNGSIALLLKGDKPGTMSLINNALYGNNLGATLSYLVMPRYYILGVGFGTQYIAESYADFGYVGIIIYNILLGFLLRIFNYKRNRNWYLSAIIYSVYAYFIIMPRNFALTWIAPFVSTMNWGCILLIIVISNTVERIKKQRNDSIMAV
jgi:oligosaccharide repeat unit polymerase